MVIQSGTRLWYKIIDGVGLVIENRKWSPITAVGVNFSYFGLMVEKVCIVLMSTRTASAIVQQGKKMS